MHVLKVNLQGQEVGTLTLLPGDRTIFSFNEGYVNLPSHQRSTLSQSFISRTGGLLTETRPCQTKLMPFFSNLLPEGFLRSYLAERGGIKPEREFFLLKLLGQDLPGALTIEGDETQKGEGRETFQETSMNSPESPLRFSLAGVQLKFSAVLQKKGLTIPVGGKGGDWIVKLPSHSYPNVPENEESMLYLAREVGIEVPEFRLIPVEDIEGLPSFGPLGGKMALAVKRFDRTDKGDLVHMEDFAQVYGVYPEDKYDKVSYSNIANMVYTLGGEEALSEYIQRLVFYILIGNGDMHLKNWSFLYKDRIHPSLSPAYDIVSTICYIPNDRLALNLLGTKEMKKVDLGLFEELAVKRNLPKRAIQQVVIQTAETTRSVWESHKRNLNLSKESVEIIDSHIKECALAQ